MLVLRPAQETDIPRLVEVARRSVLSAFAFTAPFPLLQDWIRRDPEPARYAAGWQDMTVAELDGEVVGLVHPVDDEIHGLWVHPGAQGRGIGGALLRAGEERIAASGHGRAWLSCSGFNPRAQGFYLAQGYRETRRQVEVGSSGVPDEMIVYERHLP
ncbi:MAG: GNAT family N-acetyltransferase [Gemmatimonadetes bacterium]|nr:GNAT family N-acetyltransferase [Gemmatimonadota bacterium]